MLKRQRIDPGAGAAAVFSAGKKLGVDTDLYVFRGNFEPPQDPVQLPVGASVEELEELSGQRAEIVRAEEAIPRINRRMDNMTRVNLKKFAGGIKNPNRRGPMGQMTIIHQG